MTNSGVTFNYTEIIPDLQISSFNHGLTTVQQQSYNSPVYIIVCALGLVFAFGIILLNGIVIKALLLSRMRQDVSHCAVAYLSLADLLTGVVLIYLALYGLMEFGNLYECLIRIGLIYTVSLSSYIHLLTITIDRYIKIIHPFLYSRIFKITTIKAMSSIIWLFSTVIGFLPLLGWHKEITHVFHNDGECLFFGIITDGYFKLNFSINVCIITLTSLLYGRIIYVARKHHNAISRDHESSFMIIDKHAWKLARTVFLVVVVTNLLWLPGAILIILHISGTLNHISIETKGEFLAYSGLFAYVNCFINPIIYAFKITSVRRLFYYIFCCRPYDQRNPALIPECYEMGS